MTTLDEYRSSNIVGDASFVKVDIEGAEMMFLKGAERLFAQKSKPIILMEMALAQTSRFGYSPNDLIGFIAERGPYLFYRIDEVKRRLSVIDGFAPGDIGANVFCVPQTAADRVRAAISEFL